MSAKFQYPLKNKYECLSAVSGPASNVTILEEASACLNEFFDYLVEKCLEKLEAEYNGNIGFTGSPSPPGTEDPLAWKDVYFTTYGNTSLSQADIDSVLQIEAAKGKQEQLAAEAETRSGGYEMEFGELELDQYFEQFLCNNRTDLVFRSNPFDDSALTGKPSVNEFVANFGCEKFFIFDEETQVNQTVVHYYMEEKLGLRSMTAGGLLNDSVFFVNRTTLNEQEFRLTFHKDLEFLDVLGT